MFVRKIVFSAIKIRKYIGIELLSKIIKRRSCCILGFRIGKAKGREQGVVADNLVLVFEVITDACAPRKEVTKSFPRQFQLIKEITYIF